VFSINSQAFSSHPQFILVAPVLDTFVQINAVQGNSDYYVTGCSDTSEIAINLMNGENTIYLGSGGKIQGFHCTIIITGSPGQNDSLFIQSINEATSLSWTINDSFIHIFDSSNSQSTYLLLFIYDIEILSIQFGSMGNYVDLISVLSTTELILNFPSFQNGTFSNAIQIGQTSKTTLLTGVFDLTVGPNPATSLPVNPLTFLQGMIAIVGNDFLLTSIVTLNSGIGTNAPSQTYFLGSDCLTYQLTPPLVPPSLPSPWMCDNLISAGFSPNLCISTSFCPIAYLGNIEFDISTGSGSDTFIGINSLASVNVYLGDSNDTFFWQNTTEKAIFDAGDGPDIVNLISPFSQTTLLLGLDQDVDVANIYSADLKPNFSGSNVVSPVGPNPQTDALTIQQIYPRDLIYIKGGNNYN